MFKPIGSHRLLLLFLIIFLGFHIFLWKEFTEDQSHRDGRNATMIGSDLITAANGLQYLQDGVYPQVVGSALFALKDAYFRTQDLSLPYYGSSHMAAWAAISVSLDQSAALMTRISSKNSLSEEDKITLHQIQTFLNELMTLIKSSNPNTGFKNVQDEVFRKAESDARRFSERLSSSS